MKKTLLLLFFMVLGLTTFAQVALNPKADAKRPSDKTELQLFPNPTTDYISLNDNEVVEKLVVYNLLGREVRRFNYVKGEKYSVEDLARGMYLVQMLGPSDRIVTTQRLNKR